MKPKTEELLYMLLWTCDMLTRPTFRNLTDSFESWAYRNGFLQQLARLEQQTLIVSQGETRSDRAYRLTSEGRLQALGGRDPEERWGRRWDGKWRLVLFDFPQAEAKLRDRLRRHLRDRGFGYLQNSVWITPDSLGEERQLVADGSVAVESLIFLEARPAAGETDAEIVGGAWDFERINRLYNDYLSLLENPPAEALDVAAAKAIQRWCRVERLAWLEAVSQDPLLPDRLLPAGYIGKRVWRTRTKVLGELAERMRHSGVAE
jgi:phenylacetic acid degradation operon negative regulatory protein